MVSQIFRHHWATSLLISESPGHKTQDNLHLSYRYNRGSKSQKILGSIDFPIDSYIQENCNRHAVPGHRFLSFVKIYERLAGHARSARALSGTATVTLTQDVGRKLRKSPHKLLVVLHDLYVE